MVQQVHRYTGFILEKDDFRITTAFESYDDESTTVTMAVEWTTEETRVLLRVWGDADIQNKFDGVVRNRHIYGGKYEEAWV